jgi:hypothetical protein
MRLSSCQNLIPNLKQLAERRGLERTPFWNLVERMCKEGLIQNAAAGGFYRIAAPGVIHAEETGIAPKEPAETNQKARTQILLALAKVYDERGSLYSVQNSRLVGFLVRSYLPRVRYSLRQSLC